ncbi:hypothetical protein Arub01_58780 [Actinomadura rubrobrunea]|uniref:Uncharacterized protein n=1 Tax=Actinomadura rubrobrunea TaxID=115335 RepID=A0A9W6Q0G3_9ACTN|nr:hypothetical protein Arub01_58780 [Actinomadura rubrobrunea]
MSRTGRAFRPETARRRHCTTPRRMPSFMGALAVGGRARPVERFRHPDSRKEDTG